MPDIICVLGWFELLEDDFDGVADGIERSRGHPPKQGFQLCEDLFDGIEVRAIGRKVQQVHSGIFKTLANAGDLVGRQVVDDDDAPGLHLRDKALFEPLPKDEPGHRAREQLRSQDTIVHKPSHKGRCHPVTMWVFCNELLAFITPAVGARHRRVGAGLIDKNKAGEVQICLRCLPQLACQGDVRPILLRRINRFF